MRLMMGLAAITLILSLLVIVSRLSGQQTGLSAAALLDPGACAQPCWHDIQIGKTTFRQAVAILRADKARITGLNEQVFEQDAATLVYWDFVPDSHLHWYGAIDIQTANADLPVRALVLWGDDFALGDAIVLWGDPTALVVCPTNMINIGSIYSPTQNAMTAVTRRVWAAHAFFRGSIEVVAYGNEQSGGVRLSPQTRVSSIMYNDPANAPPYRLDAVPWQGLAPIYAPTSSYCTA